MSQYYISELIKTKLLPPVNRSNIVTRSKLLEIFGSSLSRKLILVSAPAGSGKTTLLGQCFKIIIEKKYGPCWLSLDENDNNPETFLRYIIFALKLIDEKIGSEIIQHIDIAHSSDISSYLPSLVNELVMVDKEIFLFIDDFHFITSLEIIQFIELLLNISPQNFHIIISGRVLPNLPLANMRVRDDLLEISSNKLRFDFNESEKFLVKSRGLQLDDSLLTILYERCDGWAAGLQLASLSLRETQDYDQFVQNFSGNIKDISDYLAVTVLDKQPESIREFLFNTAILDRFNADLCNYLLDRVDSSVLLHQLELENLFIVPLDQEREWYRYHPLFREFLLSKRTDSQKNQQDELNYKASNWFKEHDHLGEAVDYALSANNMFAAAELIEQRAIQEFMDGRMSLVASWIKRIPKKVQLKYYKLMLLHGTALYHMNQVNDAIYICEQLERRATEIFDQNIIDEINQNKLSSEIAILRAGINMSQDNFSTVINDSPEELHSHQDFMEGVINNIKGYAYFGIGEFDKAREYILLAHKVHRKINSKFGMVYSDCFLAMLEFYQGNLQLVRLILEQAKPTEEAFKESIYVVSVREVLLGAIDYEMNSSSKILESLQNNLKTLENVGHSSLIYLGYITLAKYLYANGSSDLAFKYLDYLGGLYPQSDIHQNNQLLVGYNKIKLQLRSGKLNEALRTALLMNISLDEELPELPLQWNSEAFHKKLMQARIWLAAGQHETLISVAQYLYDLAHKTGMEYLAVECLLLLSQAHLKSGNQCSAISTMKKALSKTISNNIIRLYVDEGVVILPILQKVEKGQGGSNVVFIDYTRAIIDAISPNKQQTKTLEHPSAQIVNLVEPLSQRELDILKLMGEGKANAGIADILYISENTVKWHTRNFFAKMGVRNRTEAVIKALDLGLLENR
jgi:LuxR family maltose regulon positive regulatory protein